MIGEEDEIVVNESAIEPFFRRLTWTVDETFSITSVLVEGRWVG